MNPEDLAASRHKEIAKARERIQKADAARARCQTRLEELRGQIGSAEFRDRQALGQALVDGKAEPASEAARLKAELEQEERNAEALELAASSAREQISEVVKGQPKRVEEAGIPQPLSGSHSLQGCDFRGRGCPRGAQFGGKPGRLAGQWRWCRGCLGSAGRAYRC